MFPGRAILIRWRNIKKNNNSPTTKHRNEMLFFNFIHNINILWNKQPPIQKIMLDLCRVHKWNASIKQLTWIVTIAFTLSTRECNFFPISWCAAYICWINFDLVKYILVKYNADGLGPNRRRAIRNPHVAMTITGVPVAILQQFFRPRDITRRHRSCTILLLITYGDRIIPVQHSH